MQIIGSICFCIFALMNKPFNTHTEGIDLNFWHDLIKSHGKLVTLARNELLCKFGEPSSLLGWVVSGYFNYEFSANNDFFIGGFAFPKALVGNYPDCMKNGPIPFTISAGQKSEVLVMDATILQDIYDTDFDACRHGRILAEQVYRSLLNRYSDLYTKSPIERYLDLIHQHPQVVQQISQKELAAYLNITPIHLCRIRKELLKR